MFLFNNSLNKLVVLAPRFNQKKIRKCKRHQNRQLQDYQQKEAKIKNKLWNIKFSQSKIMLIIG